MHFDKILILMGGLGVFFFGVKELSDSMEKLANRKLKSLFQKSSKNPFIGIGVGTAATVLVQSSSLTTVMIVGFVNAGLMTLYQATAFIMGANIGTTITAQLASLVVFDIEPYFIALTCLGMVLAMLSKKQKLKTVGTAIAGLGLIFVGLNLMTNAMSSVRNSPAIVDLFSKLENPILLLFMGFAITAIIQSSSAVTSILISLAAAGISVGGGGNAPYFIVLGTNIGSCITALLSSLGGSKNAKRASLIHLLFNVAGSVIFFILLLCWRDLNKSTFAAWFPEPATQIAMFHTFFNVTCTLIFLPFINSFVYLVERLVKKDNPLASASLIDERFLNAPTVAIEQSNKEMMRMADLAMNCLREGFECFLNKDVGGLEKVGAKISKVNTISQNLTDYLVQISSYSLTINDEKRISILHSNNIDLTRLADIADNFTRYTAAEVRDEMKFSEGIFDDLRAMFKVLEELFEATKAARLTKDKKLLSKVDECEGQLDAFRKRLISEHIERLNNGECAAATSSVFINLVSNIERAGDHLTLVAHTIKGKVKNA